MTEALAGEEFYEGDNPLADNDDDDDDYSSEDNEEETQWERVGVSGLLYQLHNAQDGSFYKYNPLLISKVSASSS